MALKLNMKNKKTALRLRSRNKLRAKKYLNEKLSTMNKYTFNTSSSSVDGADGAVSTSNSNSFADVTAPAADSEPSAEDKEK